MDWKEKAERASDAINKLTSGTLEYVPNFRLYECVFADQYEDDGETFTEMASVVVLTNVGKDTDKNRALANKNLDKIIHEYAEDLSLCLKNMYKEKVITK